MSLVEVLMAATLTAIVLLPILGIFNFIYSQWNKQASRGTTLQSANLAMDLMAAEIGKAMAMDVISSDTIYFILPADKDAAGNYVPAWQSGRFQYRSGTEVRFYPSNFKGNSEGGSYLWRGSRSTGGLLSSITTSWDADETWSMIGGTSGSRAALFPGLESITFTRPVTLSANTVRITLRMSTTQGDSTTTTTLTRDVYLANHN